jgi:hypothetical protein
MKRLSEAVRRRLLWAGAIVLTLVVAAAVSRSRPTPDVRAELPEMIFSDSVPDPRAVGLCARSRATGVVEGEIVGLVQRAPEEVPRYRVRSREHAGAEYVMEGAMVQVVKCEDTTTVALPTRRGRRAAR